MVARRSSGRRAPDTTSQDSGRVNVPKLNRDPIQSLRPWPVIVTFHGVEYEIPALPAADWLSVLMVEQLHLDDIFPGLLAAGQAEQVEDVLFQVDLDVDEFLHFSLDIVEMVAGRRWWVAMRLIELARTSWDVLGAEMALKGVDADRVSLSSWLDQLLLIALRSMEAKDITMFTMKLELPPPTEEAEEMVMSRDAFLALGN